MTKYGTLLDECVEVQHVHHRLKVHRKAQRARQNLARGTAVAVRLDCAAGCATHERLGRALLVKEQALVTHARRVALARDQHAVSRRRAVRHEAVAVHL